ncbi:MAG TPA: YlxR family protein [Clostridia bacterium]|nr:YlxR family protein [Clostridia bacterium]
MKLKKVPLRMCLGCQEMKPKKELIRIVRDKEGNTSVDFTGKKAGRGAYICRSADCFDKAKKGKRLEKAFEARIDDAVYDTLKLQLEGNDG